MQGSVAHSHCLAVSCCASDLSLRHVLRSNLSLSGHHSVPEMISKDSFIHMVFLNSSVYAWHWRTHKNLEGNSQEEPKFRVGFLDELNSPLIGNVLHARHCTRYFISLYVDRKSVV